MIDPSLKNQNESNYINMINYLISSLNKAKSATIPNQLHNKPIFLYEFFVFELYLPRELIRKIKQPLLAFRLLDFPTLTIQGNIAYGKESIVFNQGKSSYFEMEVSELRESLVNQPMYIMFVDLNHGDTKVIASSRLNISIFSYDSFLQYSGDTPKPRRNILKLFDNALQKVAEFEMSLLIRREYYKYEINSFPLNQEKIFVNNNHLDNRYATSNSNEHRFNEETMKKGIYDRPYSNDLRMKSTDDIMKSDHIRMNVEEKTVHFITALADVYRDEEHRELEALPQMEMTDDFTEDFTAMLIGMQFICKRLTGYDGDLIDFTHMLNKLAVQNIMEKQNNNLIMTYIYGFCI